MIRRSYMLPFELNIYSVIFALYLSPKVERALKVLISYFIPNEQRRKENQEKQEKVW